MKKVRSEKKCFHWNFLIYFTYAGLSIRARGWEFPLATMGVASATFIGK